MYKGYSIETSEQLLSDCLNQKIRLDLDLVYKNALAEYRSYKEQIHSRINTLKDNEALRITGNELEWDCFPQADFDVFISHSHKDERLAVIIAGLLKQYLGIKAFVDSQVWDFYDVLINKFFPRDAIPCNWTRTDCLAWHTTVVSYVSCLLNKALIEMMDRCECLFFLNTPNSASLHEVSQQTKSAWIYNELEASRRIRRITPTRLAIKKPQESTTLDSLEGFIGVELPSMNIDTNHLSQLSTTDLVSWILGNVKNGHHGGLDFLYTNAQ